MHKKLLKTILTFTASAFFVAAQAQTSISITSSTSDTICSGTSVTFTEVATGGSHYQWLKNSVVIGGATNTTYSTTSLVNGDVVMCELLTGSGGSILALSNPITMTVQHMPVISAISGADTVCRGSTTTLTDATTGGSWNTSNAFLTSVSSSGVVTGINAGLDTIMYSISNLCGSDTVRLSMYVNTLPFLAPITGPNTVCRGATATYVDSPLTGTWSVSTPSVGTINSTGGFSALAIGIDTVFNSITNSCGTTTRRRPVTVIVAPVAGAITGSNTVCQGDTIHLRDTPPGGNWHSQNNGIAGVMGAGGGGNVGIVHGNGGGTVTIVYVIANACGADSASTTITVNPLPFVYPIIGRDSVCPGGTWSEFEFTTGGTWTSSNPSIATVDATGLVTGITAGTDSILYTVINTCGAVHAAIPMSVYCPSDVSVPAAPAAAEIALFPNPAHDALSVQGTDAALIEIMNVFGSRVLEVHNANTVMLTTLPNGVYFVTVTDKNGLIATRQRIMKL